MMETVGLIKELDLFDVSVQTFTPLPGAEIYSRVCDLGDYVENWEKSVGLEEIVFVPDGLSQDMINDYVNKAYDACYNRAFQWVMAPKRFYTMKHFKAIMKFYFGR
jgi:hypothetical protein